MQKFLTGQEIFYPKMQIATNLSFNHHYKWFSVIRPNWKPDPLYIIKGTSRAYDIAVKLSSAFPKKAETLISILE